MSEQPFSDVVALRIALAARILPDTSIAHLIEAIEDAVGTPIDEAALARVTVTHLKTSFDRTYDLDGVEDDGGSENPRTKDMAAFKDAVRALWGELSTDESGPELEAPTPEQERRSIRVAVASNTGEQLDGHFGSCLRFLVYEVTADSLKLIAARDTLDADASSDKNSMRVQLIDDCQVVYIVSVGGPAAAKIIRARIHIVPVPAGGAAREVLATLQATMASAPPPWLAKILGIAPEQRLKNYRAISEA
jgi:nitrogen fixation protein NifX